MEKNSGSVPLTNEVELLRYAKHSETQEKTDAPGRLYVDCVDKHAVSIQARENKHYESDNAKGSPNFGKKERINKIENTDEETVKQTRKIEASEINTGQTLESSTENLENETDNLMFRGRDVGGRNSNEIGETGGKDVSGKGRQTIPPDGGWGWVVLAGSFVIMVSSSIGPCFTLVFSPLFLDLRTSPSTVSWIFNSFSLIWNLVSPAVGPLTKEFGHRRVAIVGSVMVTLGLLLSAFATSAWVLFFSFSLLGGIGLGILVTISNIIIPVYFTNHLGRANGILMTGISVGMFLLPHLITFLQDLYMYKGAMLILSAIFLNTCLAALVFHPVKWYSKTVVCKGDCSSKIDIQLNQASSQGPPEGKNLLKNHMGPSVATVKTPEQSQMKRKFCELCSLLLRVCRSTILSLKILFSPPAFIIALSGCLTMNGYLNFIMMVPFEAEKLFPGQGSALCVSVAGILNLVSRLVMSALKDTKWFDLRVGYIVSISVIALANIVFPFMTTLRSMAITMGFWGYGIGSFMGLYNLVMIEYIGIKKLPDMFGASSLLNGIGFICLGPMLGKIKELVGSYSVSIFVLAAIECACVVLWLLMPAAVARQKRNSERISV